MLLDPGTDSISLHIAAERENVIVVLTRESFEPALIHVALSRSEVMCQVAHRLSRADPAHEPAEFSVHSRLQNPVPMIGHQLEAEEFDRIGLQAFRQNPLERGVVLWLVKNFSTPIPAIEGMVYFPRLIVSWCSWCIRQDNLDSESMN